MQTLSVQLILNFTLTFIMGEIGDETWQKNSFIKIVSYLGFSIQKISGGILPKMNESAIFTLMKVKISTGLLQYD